MIDVASLASLSMHFQNERKKGWKNKKKKTDFFFPVSFVNVLCVSVYFCFILIFFCTLANDF